MAHFVGLDVSVAETSICIVDEHGKIARERKVPTEPEAIIEALNESGQVCERIGLEAGPLPQFGRGRAGPGDGGGHRQSRQGCS
jgi:transposase